jgi:hypothetical protein
VFISFFSQSPIYGRRNTEILGFGNEIGQCSDKETFFSYEDLPSNKHGAIFGENLLCSELLGIFLLKKPKKLSEYLEEYFNELGAMDPKEAPNYEYIPRFDNAENSAKNFTSRKIVPYIPKTPQPLPKPGPRPVPTPSS